MKQAKVRLFVTGGDYSNDFTPHPVLLDDALEEIELKTSMNQDQLGILIVPSSKSKVQVLALLRHLREAVEEGFPEYGSR